MTWLPLALFALAVWSLQRVVTKVALLRWSTARFYRWNAIVSAAVYIPFAFVLAPEPARLPGAILMSLYMAVAFWVATEATRRGPVGAVAPLTASSPAITAVLAIVFIGERPDALALVGIAAAVVAAVLIALRPAPSTVGPWLGFAIGSLLFQGLGAFLAKLVVSDTTATTLLVPSVIVQLAVGVVIAREEPLELGRSVRGSALIVTLILAAAAVATVGYLSALSTGPASIIVPLVATSPTLGGLLGIIFLKEHAGRTQAAGIAIGLAAILLLARAA